MVFADGVKAVLRASFDGVAGVGRKDRRDDADDHVAPHDSPGRDRPAERGRRDQDPEASQCGDPAATFGGTASEMGGTVLVGTVLRSTRSPATILLHMAGPLVIAPDRTNGDTSTHSTTSAAIQLDLLAIDAASVVTDDACSVAMGTNSNSVYYNLRTKICCYF